MAYLDDSIAQLSIFEGSVAWMYLDSRGFVTVGVGEMLPNVGSAQALGFVDGSGAAATAAEIGADFFRVASLEPNLRPAAYRSPSSPQLPPEVIASVLRGHLAEFDGELAARFANYAAFPEPAKLGLLDMIYNLGESKLFSGFPTFIRYVGEADWANAALQCHRVGPGDARNAWTANQFNLAATMQAAGA
jgi:GH24 family phage-related lysozyme (muramidase)